MAEVTGCEAPAKSLKFKMVGRVVRTLDEVSIVCGKAEYRAVNY